MSLAKFGHLNALVDEINNAGAGNPLDVTQSTAITTAVPVTALRGTITTVSSTLAANSSTTFSVTQPDLLAGHSQVFLQVAYAGAGASFPVANVESVVDGSFNVILRNLGTSALNAAVHIQYFIIV